MSERVAPAGISAAELAQRTVVYRSVDRLTPQALEQWLLRRRLAERLPTGELRATPLGAQLGRAVGPLEGA